MADPQLKKQIRQSFQDYERGMTRSARDFLAELEAGSRK